MSTIQFSHANGFPGSSYNFLFSQLAGCQVSYVEKMGHGDYPLNNDLRNYARELIRDIEQRGQSPIVGMGHSAGAVVTLIAAALRPDLFSQVILLDPVLFSRRKRYLLRLIKKMGLIDRITPAGRAEKRRAVFTDRQQAATYFRGKRLFKTFHPNCFADYIRYGLRDTDQGVELSIAPEIEADIFRNVLLSAPRCLKTVRGCVIYGEHSDLFSRSDRQWWRRNFPDIQLVGIEGGHLFPFEQPVETAALIRKQLESPPTGN
ncbi:alpha/beta fold hydrolase [Neptuniibacter halophilus]|uniref:alpha/beta fold hydrolase n=1 Tax=Neptuniibacter halophilus TaxID=651666 RepID=UPI002572874F|nr:alpha/beta hydrolase [Neptuniibacter halophilus]